MWLKNKIGKKRVVQMIDLGAGAIGHNVLCWLCDEKSAVYYANPKFVFYPCWSCQEIYEGEWTKKKSWWERIFKL
jgi:hypothetical protein